MAVAETATLRVAGSPKNRCMLVCPRQLYRRGSDEWQDLASCRVRRRERQKAKGVGDVIVEASRGGYLISGV
ncbi:hypothetical protein [Nitrosospira multiformis]|uniref:hypothetical protein n=1 Tax=Nitrosospira multiformis TaxID=1231 RepID=UPI0015E244C0|nr:hypothetical protein [Nitrosospira multiformis]